MKRCCSVVSLLIFSAQFVTAQPPANSGHPKKGFIYFALGSNRVFYTASTIHIKRNDGYPLNFTLYKVKGKDEGGFKWDTAPQFSYTLGYYFSRKKFGLEYQYDHIKYFVRQNQSVWIKGNINGVYYNQDTLIHPGFFQLEHSDGANYGMLNVIKWMPLYAEKNHKYVVSLLIKGGIGFVHPKTNSTISGEYRDDKYHFSGYIIGGGIRSTYQYREVLFCYGYFKRHLC